MSSKPYWSDQISLSGRTLGGLLLLCYLFTLSFSSVPFFHNHEPHSGHYHQHTGNCGSCCSTDDSERSITEGKGHNHEERSCSACMWEMMVKTFLLSVVSPSSAIRTESQDVSFFPFFFLPSRTVFLSIARAPPAESFSIS